MRCGRGRYDFHVAQNDGTVFGSGDHEKTGRHCQVDDPNGKLDVPKHAGYWLRDDNGNLTKKMRHICWDGCMFPNAVMDKQQTWNKVLGDHDQGARRARLARIGTSWPRRSSTSAIIGYGFMGRAHSNACRNVAGLLRRSTISRC